MWGLILGFLGNSFIGPFINGLLAAYRERLAAINTQDALALDLLKAEIAAEVAARAEANKLIIAEQGHWYTAMIRPLFAAPFIIFAFKVVVWDKVLGFGVTDALDPKMWGIFNTIVISYFGATAIERVSKIFRR